MLHMALHSGHHASGGQWLLGFFAATGMDEHVDLGTRVEAGEFTGKVLAACKKEPRQTLAIAAHRNVEDIFYAEALKPPRSPTHIGAEVFCFFL